MVFRGGTGTPTVITIPLSLSIQNGADPAGDVCRFTGNAAIS